jgi:protein SSD1
MGLVQPQQPLGQVSAYSPTIQGGASMAGVSPHVSAFQFPQIPQQQLNVPINPSNPSSHRRNQSALPGIGLGPPPAPSSGASGSAFADLNPQGGQNRENGGQGRGRGGPIGSGHQRRHSLALPEAKKAAELAQQKRTTSGFQNHRWAT